MSIRSRKYGAVGVLSGVLLGGLAGGARAGLTPIQLTQAGPARGIQAYQPATGMSTGITVADYDNDGDADILVPQRHGHRLRLYRNDGGIFTDVAVQSGLLATNNDRSALFFDYDGDDDLDLAVLSDTFQQQSMPEHNRVTLYRNDGAAGFVDVSAAAGLDAPLAAGHEHQGGGMSAGDLDQDGDLDLIVCLWEARSRVYLNNADGTFTPAGVETGIADSTGTDWQPIIVDLDRDGRQDVLMSYDFGPNWLWMNRGHGQAFEDIAGDAGCATAFNEMGVAPGDPDNDGDLDFYMTNIAGTDTGGAIEHNVLFENISSGTGGVRFREIAQSAGVDQGGVGWGAVFVDLDLDTREDLAEANTFEFPNPVATRLWRHTGAGAFAFEDISVDSGFATTDPCTSLVSFDMDHDGDHDLLMPSLFGTLYLFENTLDPASAGRNWLVVRPRMASGMNRRAIGAVVHSELSDGTLMTRLISAGSSFAGQQPAEAHFGLGAHDTVARLTVTWPDGTHTTLGDVPGNQRLVVESPCPCGERNYDIDGDGRVSIDDLHHITQAAVDLNNDGSADGTDASCVERILRRRERQR